MTKEDAEDFLEQVLRSRDPRIAPFRDMILAKAKEYKHRHGTEIRGGDEE
jgi:hypothetical protein